MRVYEEGFPEGIGVLAVLFFGVLYLTDWGAAAFLQGGLWFIVALAVFYSSIIVLRAVGHIEAERITEDDVVFWREVFLLFSFVIGTIGFIAKAYSLQIG